MMLLFPNSICFLLVRACLYLGSGLWSGLGWGIYGRVENLSNHLQCSLDLPTILQGDYYMCVEIEVALGL